MSTEVIYFPISYKILFCVSSIPESRTSITARDEVWSGPAMTLASCSRLMYFRSAIEYVNIILLPIILGIARARRSHKAREELPTSTGLWFSKVTQAWHYEAPVLLPGLVRDASRLQTAKTCIRSQQRFHCSKIQYD